MPEVGSMHATQLAVPVPKDAENGLKAPSVHLVFLRSSFPEAPERVGSRPDFGRGLRAS